MIPLIAVAFLCLAALTLWTVIGARGPWQAKLALIVVVTAYTFAVWHALGSFTGWPTTEPFPKRALYMSSVVVEPTAETKGAIYVWVIPPDKGGLLEYRNSQSEPRAYRLPYTRPAHEQIQKANEMAAKGQRVELQGTARKNADVRRAPFRAYQLPPVGLPVKQ